MGKTVNTCLSCRKRKIKCSRDRPSCSSCLASKSNCLYLDQPSNPGISKSGPQKGRKQDLQSAASRASIANVNILPVECSNEADQTTTLTGEMAEKLALEMIAEATSIPVNIWKAATLSSNLLRYSIRGLGYDQLDKIAEASSALKLASLYLTEVLSHPSVVGVKALLSFAKLHFRLSRIDEGTAYYSYGINMAKEIGINREDLLSELCGSEEQKEACRNLWWHIYSMDQFFRFKNRSVLLDQDNGLFLPDSTPSAMEGTLDLGRYILSSSDWFTPPLENQSISACKILLVRILGKILQFHSYYHLQNDEINVKYVVSVLESSLQLWWNHLPDRFVQYLPWIQFGGQITKGESLRVFEILFLYNFARTQLLLPLLLSNQSTVDEENLKYFLQLTAIANENVSVLNVITNPVNLLLAPNPVFLFPIFHTTVLIYLASEANLPTLVSMQLKKSLSVHVHCFQTLYSGIKVNFCSIMSASLVYLKYYPYFSRLADEFIKNNIFKNCNGQYDTKTKNNPNIFEYIKDPFEDVNQI
ncbi:hypothetical protein HDV06_005941 [Boothiomyces sp. JEL0866]|nr:hypothetical protein HDV06_005941 [Boothiomyces sp. JEL0866]